ncbi:MAG: hypothetical protein KME12_19190 [Trichocoleus desertorum ATA4-8-CV12]|jgi:BMFP domain-containing protein YqiC|nr:hypothetical protein [Trichocoleus desertorum ATA4-8-CV12]
MSKFSRQWKSKLTDHERLSNLEQRIEHLEDRFSQVEHLAIWDSPNGEIMSVADWIEHCSRR